MDNNFEVTWDDLSEDLKELVEFGLFTKEEALEKHKQDLKASRIVSHWWQRCIGCINWGQVTGMCRYCSRCPFSAGNCGDGFIER